MCWARRSGSSRCTVASRPTPRRSRRRPRSRRTRRSTRSCSPTTSSGTCPRTRTTPRCRMRWWRSSTTSTPWCRCTVSAVCAGATIAGSPACWAGRTASSRRGLAARLRDALPGYHWIDDLGLIPSHLRGVHPDNPVNRPARGGVQLELPPRVRRTPGDAAALDRCVGRRRGTDRNRFTLLPTGTARPWPRL